MPHRLPAALLAVILAALAAFAAVATAQDTSTEPAKDTATEPVATVENVETGTTYVRLDKGFTDALAELGLTPSPLGQAQITQDDLRLPITGGKLTYFKPGEVSPFVQGELRHLDSGLRLTGEKGTRVSLKDFVIDPGTSTLTGSVFVDGERKAERAPLFFLDGSTLEPLRTTEDAAVLEGTTVELKEEAAQVLNEAFSVDALEAGLKVGTAKIVVRTGASERDPVAQIENIPSGTTYLTLDKGFTDALQQLGLEPSPTGAAELTDGSLRFPITGGDLTYYEPGTVSPFVQGLIRHRGGLRLTAGNGVQVTLDNFRIDPGTSTLIGDVSAAGRQVAQDVPLFFLDGRTLEPLRTTDDAAVLEGTTVKLNKQAADLLGKTFDTDALEGGLKVGTAKIVARTGQSQG